MITLEEFTACGAHQEGHFLLSSGLHSSDYMQCALYLAKTARAERAGLQLAVASACEGMVADLVVGPAMGGLLIGHEVARALDLPFMFTERVDGEMKLRRGFGLLQGQKILIVEDVVTTGKSSREVARLLEAFGGKVVGVVSIVNRSGKSNPFEPLPYAALMNLEFPTWKPEECPLCATGVEIAKPGSRPIS